MRYRLFDTTSKAHILWSPDGARLAMAVWVVCEQVSMQGGNLATFRLLGVTTSARDACAFVESGVWQPSMMAITCLQSRAERRAQLASDISGHSLRHQSADAAPLAHLMRLGDGSGDGKRCRIPMYGLQTRAAMTETQVQMELIALAYEAADVRKFVREGTLAVTCRRVCALASR